MDIIVKNGKLTIKGSNADRKAFETVKDSLKQIAEFGGGGIGDSASECHAAINAFLEAHKGVLEFAPERKAAAATA